MPDNTASKPANPGAANPQLQQAISLFEGLLVTQPDDRVALEALSLAYAQTGETARARTCLIRLANVLVREGDVEAASVLVDRLRPFANDDLDALEALRSIEQLTAQPGGEATEAAATTAPAPESPPPPRSAAPVSDVTLRRQILQREMALAWDLLQAGELSQDDYATVIQDLTNLTAEDQIRTISVLHDLVDRSLPCFERVLLHMARRSGLPILPLTAFDPQAEAYECLPYDYIVRQGAMPFERIGNELLVSVLNPMDVNLRRDVEAMAGRRCHFFLASPTDYDSVLQVVHNRSAAAAS